MWDLAMSPLMVQCHCRKIQESYDRITQIGALNTENKEEPVAANKAGALLGRRHTHTHTQVSDFWAELAG